MIPEADSQGISRARAAVGDVQAGRQARLANENHVSDLEAGDSERLFGSGVRGDGSHVQRHLDDSESMVSEKDAHVFLAMGREVQSSLPG
jgi:hypothetical protein